jgi:hypothetical protein
MPLDPDQIREERARELLYLERFLNKTTRVRGTTTLVNAATECKRDKPGDDLWGYSLAGLVFEPEDLRHMMPPDATDVLIELDMDIVGHCSQQPDPLAKLKVNIVVNGKLVDGDTSAPLMFSWHLDRHVGVRTEEDTSHPRYHFQHAGRVMQCSDSKWGSAIFLDPPRIMFPPMNAFTACDFILNNFLPTIRNQLAEDGNYRKWLRRAQIDMWKPYVDAISRAWSGNGGAACLDYWPDLIF